MVFASNYLSLEHMKNTSNSEMAFPLFKIIYCFYSSLFLVAVVCSTINSFITLPVLLYRSCLAMANIFNNVLIALCITIDFSVV